MVATLAAVEVYRISVSWLYVQRYTALAAWVVIFCACCIAQRKGFVWPYLLMAVGAGMEILRTTIIWILYATNYGLGQHYKQDDLRLAERFWFPIYEWIGLVSICIFAVGCLFQAIIGLRRRGREGGPHQVEEENR